MERNNKLIFVGIMFVLFGSFGCEGIDNVFNKTYYYLFNMIKLHSDKKPYNDPFYLVDYTYGYRLPILNPYKLNHSFTDGNKKNEWSSFDSDPFFKDVWQADSIAVIDSLIFIKFNSTHSNINGQYYSITDCKSRQELYFKNRQLFIDHLKNSKVLEPKWLLINSVFNRYEKTGLLPWLNSE